jgi:hypothetical protein
MGRTPTRVLLHLALLYIFIPPVAGGDGGGLTANSSGSKGITCSAAVRPVDAVPIRSPQAVHSVLASEYFAGKHIVEIGTRNGDGISCFSKTAASSIAFEAKDRMLMADTYLYLGIARPQPPPSPTPEGAKPPPSGAAPVNTPAPAATPKPQSTPPSPAPSAPTNPPR